ncbi:MAG: lipoyl synthase [Nitrospirota bacterium]
MLKVKGKFLPVTCKPDWLLKQLRKANSGLKTTDSLATSNLIRRLSLNTVCEEARCPNRGICYSNKTATFLILGDICTRNCSFCNVNGGIPRVVDESEPERIADAVKTLGIKHVVITSVTRDDLLDGGAKQFAKTINVLRNRIDGITIEVLTPDFKGSKDSLSIVVAAKPDIYAHNIETVERLYPSVRNRAVYKRSLVLLRDIKSMNSKITTKSGFMLGLGEEHSEILQTLYDLKEAGCDIVTIGQYLSPSKAHHPVIRYASEEEFTYWGEIARKLCFKAVFSAPLVRSSFALTVLR